MASRKKSTKIKHSHAKHNTAKKEHSQGHPRKNLFKSFFKSLENIYEVHYKKLMLIPIAMLLFFIGVLVYNQATKGYITQLDISLKGGTAITFYSNQTYELDYLESTLSEIFGTEDVSARELRDISGNLVGYDMQIGVEVNYTTAFSELGDAIGMTLDSSNANINQQSSQLASSFFSDAIWAFLVAFILMAAVIYVYFRSLVPAFTIMLSTVSDVVCVIGIFALLGMKISAGTIGALLMVVGYSIDSDILLATNIIKRKDGRLIDRVKRAIRTELTINVAAFVTYLIMLILSNVEIITHIAFVLMIAIFFDMINTWIQNAGLQRMYMENKK